MLTDRARKRRPALIAVACAGLLLVLVPVVVVVSRSEQLLGLNQPIQFDDFAFSVVGVRKAAALGQGEERRTAGGAFAVVAFKIDNKARRVSYRFNPGSLVLVDDQGRGHWLAADGQRALESESGRATPCTGPIPAGSACVVDLVFDVPADAHSLRLKFAYQSAVLQFLDHALYGKQAFHVPW